VNSTRERSPKLAGKGLLEMGHRRGAIAEQVSDRGHRSPESAWVDQVKQPQVGSEIERNTVERDAAFDAHA
jgi:hypothetical protein